MAMEAGKKLLTKHTKNPHWSLKASPQNLMLEQKAMITGSGFLTGTHGKNPNDEAEPPCSESPSTFFTNHGSRACRDGEEDRLSSSCVCAGPAPRGRHPPAWHHASTPSASAVLQAARGTRQPRAASERPAGASSSAAAAAISFQAEQRLPFSCK